MMGGNWGWGWWESNDVGDVSIGMQVTGFLGGTGGGCASPQYYGPGARSADVTQYIGDPSFCHMNHAWSFHTNGANMLMGATNAFTGETGKGSNVLTGARGQVIAEIARHYKAQGVRWVIVGDHNYGEGSSREHAALSPRLLGGAAVIARSFARIHESNLKKQGLLALTFSDPAQYDAIRENDRISLVGLRDLTPGAPVECMISHSDGTAQTFEAG